ncbi:TonB-dependent receptor [Luteolibacter sp. SL250]|uniref:TonB-dependent receptor n=1 Tax=Luteolibacter sp. SL250 TaxID=2995170 RepID=UPI002270EB9B|nr:TonB-dependent receptor [Luteolibacter sp. SL250]WAC20205.1 TonB-dependent receptor [Luteolibacter sp. SL250]
MSKVPKWGRWEIVPLVAGLCLPGVLPAEGQEGKPQELATLEVTGTRGDAPAVPAPISPSTAQVIPERIIKDLDLTDLSDMSRLTPNVSVSQSEVSRAPSFGIRGSQELTFHELGGGRTSAAYYIDDVPFQDAYGREFGMFAADGITIHKGPHGTLFGAPGPAGVFDVTTRRPEAGLAGEASYTYGSHAFHRGTAHASGEVRRGLLFGVDFLYSESEGWFEDRLTGDPYGKSESAAMLAKLIWQATDRLEFTLTAGLQHHDDDPAVYLPFATSDFRHVSADPDATATGWGAFQALRAVWKEDDWQIKSITSHRDSHSEDRDAALLFEIFKPGSLFRDRDQDVSAWTQEIRAESTDPSALLRWRTGLFFSNRNSDLDHFIRGLGPWEGRNEVQYDHQEWAAFGEITRSIGSHLELSGGLRLQFSRDHTRSSFNPSAAAAGLGAVAFTTDDREDYSAALPMAAVAWKWTETQRSYLRFSTAMQPGGLAIAAGSSNEYDAQHSVHYELGHDSSFRDDTVDLHAAAYYTDYRDYQAFQFHPAGQTIFNAEDAHAWGLEAEIRIRLTEGLELFAGAGYTHARYDDYESFIGDFSGKRVAKIPVCTLNAGASYRAAWGGVAAINWRLVGRTSFDDANNVTQGSYSLLDARLGFEKGNFGIYVFGRNLTDEEYFTHSYVFFGQPASSAGAPRMIGTEIRATF